MAIRKTGFEGGDVRNILYLPKEVEKITTASKFLIETVEEEMAKKFGSRTKAPKQLLIKYNKLKQDQEAFFADIFKFKWKKIEGNAEYRRVIDLANTEVNNYRNSCQDLINEIFEYFEIKSNTVN